MVILLQRVTLSFAVMKQTQSQTRPDCSLISRPGDLVKIIVLD